MKLEIESIIPKKLSESSSSDDTHMLLEHTDEEDLTEESVRPRQDQPIRRPYLGLSCGATSSFLFSVSSAIVQQLSNISPFELAAFRFVGILIPTILFLIYNRQHPWPRGKRLLLFIRGVIGVINLMSRFYAYQHMPLGDASTISFCMPVFVVIFARIFLKEACSVWNLICIALTIVGLLLLSEHQLIGLTFNKEYSQENLWAGLVAFIGTLFAANVFVVIRLLQDVHWSVILFNFSLIATVVSSGLALVTGQITMPQIGTELFLAAGLGVCGFGGQFLLTLALKWEKAGPVSIARATDIVFAFIWQVLFFNEVPTIWSVTGAMLVTSSVIILAVRKWINSLQKDSINYVSPKSEDINCQNSSS